MAQTVTIATGNALEDINRKKAITTILKHTDTDVLEILANSSAKTGSNDKVRKYKHFL